MRRKGVIVPGEGFATRPFALGGEGAEGFGPAFCKITFAFA